METKMQKLEDKVSKYFANFNELNKRRKEWHITSKNQILNTLNSINDNFKNLQWLVAKNENIKNLESVYWSMGIEMAGFEVDKKLVTRRPGYLNFAQLANGKIIVIVSYPSIDENIREEIEPMILGEYLPSEINEDMIISMAEIFLDEINDWMMNLEK